MTVASRTAVAVLVDLNQKLRSYIDELQSDEPSSQLQRELHNGDRLPDKQLARLSAETIDLLAEVEHLLEPAHLVLADHFLGYTNTKCLVAAVDLKVADHLRVRPMRLEELAKATAAKPERLGQILRPLYNNNIFRYDTASATYANNHVSEALCSDHWTQWHNWVELYGNEFYDIARGIPRAVRLERSADTDDVGGNSRNSDPGGNAPRENGHDDDKTGTIETRSAAQINFNTDLNMFDYFNARGWVPRLHRTLGGGATAMAPGILEDYPWAEIGDKTVIDIGGGGGALIALLLRAHPSMRGGIYDLPAVIEHVKSAFLHGGRLEDLAARVPQGNLIAGDFLQWVPPSEVYTIKWVLHDWTDEDALVILRNVRKAIVSGPVSRLVVLESILSDGRMGRLSRYGDINMMMTINGRERDEPQWRNLAGIAGWKVEAIYPLRNAWIHAIDLRPC
ncbi:putative O-methyltransferase [Xylaria acuta]|nr:putative O-methyltransferase [Xylaria acuta]